MSKYLKVSVGVFALFFIFVSMSSCSFGKKKRRFTASTIIDIGSKNSADCNWRDPVKKCECSDYSQWKDTCNQCMNSNGDIDGNGNLDDICSMFPPSCPDLGDDTCSGPLLCKIYPEQCNVNSDCPYDAKIKDLRDQLAAAPNNAEVVIELQSKIDEYEEKKEKECSNSSNFDLDNLNSYVCGENDSSIKDLFNNTGAFPMITGKMKNETESYSDISLKPDEEKPYVRENGSLIAYETPATRFNVIASDENPHYKCGGYCDKSNRNNYIPDADSFLEVDWTRGETSSYGNYSHDINNFFSGNIKETVVLKTIWREEKLKFFYDPRHHVRRNQDKKNYIHKLTCSNATGCVPSTPITVNCASEIMQHITIEGGLQGGEAKIPMMILPVRVLYPKKSLDMSNTRFADKYIKSLLRLYGIDTGSSNVNKFKDPKYYQTRYAGLSDEKYYIPFVEGYCNIPYYTDDDKPVETIDTIHSTRNQRVNAYDYAGTSIATQSGTKNTGNTIYNHVRSTRSIITTHYDDGAGNLQRTLESFPVPNYTLPGVNYALVEDKRIPLTAGYGILRDTDNLVYGKISKNDLVNSCINCHYAGIHSLYLMGDDDATRTGFDITLNGTSIGGSEAQATNYILSGVGFKIQSLKNAMFIEPEGVSSVSIETGSAFLDPRAYMSPNLSTTEVIARMHLMSTADNSYTWNEYKSGCSGENDDDGKCKSIGGTFEYLNPFLPNDYDVDNGTHLQNNFTGQLTPRVTVGPEIYHNMQAEYIQSHPGTIEVNLRDARCMKKIHKYLKSVYGSDYNYSKYIVVSGKNSGLKALEDTVEDTDKFKNKVGGVGYVPVGLYVMSNMGVHMVTDNGKWKNFVSNSVTVTDKPGQIILGQWSTYKKLHLQKFSGNTSIGNFYNSCYETFGTGGIDDDGNIDLYSSDYQDSLKCNYPGAGE